MARSLEKYSFAKPSKLKVLFTSKSSAGSWQIRGEQISRTRSNWLSTHEVKPEHFTEYDIFCFVKKPDQKVVDEARDKGRLVVFDIVDSWAQPEDGLAYTTVDGAKKLFGEKFSALGAHAYIFPDNAMAKDLANLVPYGTHIYHHYFPELKVTPIREKVQTVGYEGRADYLGPWKEALEDHCSKKGWSFVINPSDYNSMDIGIAVRGGEHDSFLSNRYKSNVKLANFFGAGLPCLVGAKEVACHETDNGSVRFFSTEAQLRAELDRLESVEVRQEIQRKLLSHRETFNIEAISDQYDRFFEHAQRAFQEGRIRH